MANFKKMKAVLKRNSRNGVLIGAGSILNIFPSYGNAPKVRMSDSQVLQSDWKAIGGDFKEAIKKIKSKR